MQLEKCPKICFFFKFNTNLQDNKDPNVTCENKVKDNSNDIVDCYILLAKKNNYNTITNIVNLNEISSFDLITNSINYKDIAFWSEKLTTTDKENLVITRSPLMFSDLIKNFNFPKNDNNRSFSYLLFYQ